MVVGCSRDRPSGPARHTADWARTDRALGSSCSPTRPRRPRFRSFLAKGAPEPPGGWRYSTSPELLIVDQATPAPMSKRALGCSTQSAGSPWRVRRPLLHALLAPNSALPTRPMPTAPPAGHQEAVRCQRCAGRPECGCPQAGHPGRGACMTTADALDRGRESFERRAWADAFDKLSAAERETPLAP